MCRSKGCGLGLTPDCVSVKELKRRRGGAEEQGPFVLWLCWLPPPSLLPFSKPYPASPPPPSHRVVGCPGLVGAGLTPMYPAASAAAPSDARTWNDTRTCAHSTVAAVLQEDSFEGCGICDIVSGATDTGLLRLIEISRVEISSIQAFVSLDLCQGPTKHGEAM